jgi:hypothetical protein
MFAKLSQEIQVILALKENGLKVVAPIIQVVVRASFELHAPARHIGLSETRFLQETGFLHFTPL